MFETFKCEKEKLWKEVCFFTIFFTKKIVKKHTSFRNPSSSQA